MPQSSDLIATNLGLARYALFQQSTFGQALDLRLKHPQRPNGCQVRVRVAAGPNVVVCRVTNTGKDHSAFREAAQPLLQFATNQMKGWRATPNSSGTGGGKVFWEEMTYHPPSLVPTNLNFADLLQAVMSARAACINRSRYRMHGSNRWPSEEMDNGIYPVEWTVEASGVYVVVRVSNKGRSSDAFDHLVRWAFDYIRQHNPDARDCNAQPRGVAFKTFSDVLRLEVPCL